MYILYVCWAEAPRPNQGPKYKKGSSIHPSGWPDEPNLWVPGHK